MPEPVVVAREGSAVRQEREEEDAGQRLLSRGEILVLGAIRAGEVCVKPRPLGVIHVSERADTTKHRWLVGAGVWHGQSGFSFNCRPRSITPVDVTQLATGLMQVTGKRHLSM